MIGVHSGHIRPELARPHAYSDSGSLRCEAFEEYICDYDHMLA